MAFTITPIAGSNLAQRSTSPTVSLLTAVFGNDARKYVYARASEALASTSSLTIGNAGSASSKTAGSGATYDTGAAGNGGVASGAYFWARQTAI